MTTQEQKLPDFFAPILWSYTMGALDIKKNQRLIITQTINYGSWKHWQWIASTYRKDEVRHVLSLLPETSFRASAFYLATLVFKVDQTHHALRGAHQ